MAESTYHKFLKNEVMKHFASGNDRNEHFHLWGEAPIKTDTKWNKYVDVGGYLYTTRADKPIEVRIEVKTYRDRTKYGKNFDERCLNFVVIPEDHFSHLYFEFPDYVHVIVFDEFGDLENKGRIDQIYADYRPYHEYRAEHESKGEK